MASLDEKLSSRDVLASLFMALEQSTGASWVGAVSGAPIQSMKEEEIFRWLGQVPTMREWKGGRLAKGLADFEYSLRKVLYEATLEVLLDELRRDRFNMVERRIAELAQRAQSHWAKLLSTLVINGESSVCYDGQFFFDTDHSEGSSGSQSNDITVDISTLPIPADEQGSTTDPSAKVVKAVIESCLQQMWGFKDDQGEPMNEDAMSFLVMVPTQFAIAARHATGSPLLFSETNDLASSDLQIQIAPNPRLTWTNKLAVFRTDAQVAPLIRLEDEDGLNVAAIAEGSELEFKERKHHYGIDGWRTAGYGYWQHACLATLT